MKKKSVLLSLMVVGLVAAMMAVATTATFSDQVTSTNDSEFEAGTLYLSVDTLCDLGTDAGDRTGQYGAGGVGGDSASGFAGPCDIGAVEWEAGGATVSTDNMAPGDSVTHTFDVVNEGSLDGDLTVGVGTPTVTTAGAGTACTVGGAGSDFVVAVTGAGPTDLAAGASTTVTVSVTLDADAGNNCQGAILSDFNVTFDLVQDAA